MTIRVNRECKRKECTDADERCHHDSVFRNRFDVVFSSEEQRDQDQQDHIFPE
jgi:hypothetical protein